MAIDPAVRALLDHVGWCRSLGAGDRDRLATMIVRREIPAGTQLFAAGSAAEAVYVVQGGLFGAFAPDGEALLGRIGVGETIGATGLITGHGRSATVRALRDSEVLVIERATFERLGSTHPDVWRALAAEAIQRASLPEAARRHAGPRVLALLPQHDGIDLPAVAQSMRAALSLQGRATLVDRVHGEGLDQAGWHALDRAEGRVILLGERGHPGWNAKVRAHADVLVFVGRANHVPAPDAELGGMPPAAGFRAEHILLLHERTLAPGAARRWRERRPSARVHHAVDTHDLARVARLTFGCSVNLVLSGGGARGLAHVGVIRALREAAVPIDAVGGSSVGALIGAALAAGWDHPELSERLREALVRHRPLGDLTLPLVALTGGRRASDLLRRLFGSVEIADLRLPYLTTYTDLAAGRLHVVEDGVLWQRLRAAIALPGILPPVFADGAVQVDGGLVDNLPVLAMRERFPGTTIAIDIRTDYTVAAGVDEYELPSLWQMLREWIAGRRRPSLMRILLRAGTVNSEASARAARAAADLVIAPQLRDIDLLDWQRFDEIVATGHEHAHRILAQRPPGWWHRDPGRN
jgi:NTE family protein